MKREQIYKWDWCSLCQGAYIICPLCGNNTCNGGSGTLADGTRCLKCEDAHAYYDKMEKAGKVPTYHDIARSWKNLKKGTKPHKYYMDKDKIIAKRVNRDIDPLFQGGYRDD